VDLLDPAGAGDHARGFRVGSTVILQDLGRSNNHLHRTGYPF